MARRRPLETSAQYAERLETEARAAKKKAAAADAAIDAMVRRNINLFGA
jgi:hypothetical protein